MIRSLGVSAASFAVTLAVLALALWAAGVLHFAVLPGYLGAQATLGAHACTVSTKDGLTC